MCSHPGIHGGVDEGAVLVEAVGGLRGGDHEQRPHAQQGPHGGIPVAVVGGHRHRPGSAGPALRGSGEQPSGDPAVGEVASDQAAEGAGRAGDGQGGEGGHAASVASEASTASRSDVG